MEGCKWVALVYSEDAPNTVHTTKDEIDHRMGVYQYQRFSKQGDGMISEGLRCLIFEI